MYLFYLIFVFKPEEKRQLRKTRRRRELNNKRHINEEDWLVY
jgi:hypothetical protein